MKKIANLLIACLVGLFLWQLGGTQIQAAGAGNQAGVKSNGGIQFVDTSGTGTSTTDSSTDSSNSSSTSSSTDSSGSSSSTSTSSGGHGSGGANSGSNGSGTGGKDFGQFGETTNNKILAIIGGAAMLFATVLWRRRTIN